MENVMEKNKMNEEVFDAVLKSAFADAFRDELAGYERESAAYAHERPTAAQRRIERRAYESVGRARVGALAVLRRIAAAIMIVFGLAGAVMLTVPEVRAAILDAISQWYDLHISVDREKAEANPKRVKDLHFAAELPEGWTVTTDTKSKKSARYVLTDGNAVILLDQEVSASSVQFWVGTEDADTADILLGGQYDACLVRHGDGTLQLFWTNRYLYILTGVGCSEELLIRIAESIE